jgi:sigma-B regulation protein RsbU (phosphoserine phosphatase)
VYFVIGDVSGKGVTAGLMMAGLQVAFRIFAKTDPDPSELVTQLNLALKENLPQSKFVTLFLGRLDTNTGAIEYVNAGHTPPLWLRKSGATELTESDLLLGVVRRAEFTTRRLQLDPGDSLILFTDGVTEARNDQDVDLGSEIIGEALAKLHGSDADAIASSVNDTIFHHVGDAENLDDDVTLLVVSRASEAAPVQ